MRNRIQYGQSYVLCSQPPAYQSNTGNLSGLKRIQDANIRFNFARERFKQIGSENFVSDTHLRNPEVLLDLSYLYSNGTNEALIGLNVDGTNGHALKYVTKQRQDRNYYIVQGSGENYQPLLEDDFVDDYDVMSIGNAFLENYSFSARINEPISAAARFSAYNLRLENYNQTGGGFIPAIDDTQGIETQEFKYTIETGNIFDTSNQDGLIDTALSPTHIEFVLPTGINVAGLEFTGQRMAMIQSMDLSFDIARHNLYGFGSMYPFGRRAILPVVGNMSFSALASEFETGTLHTIINSGESEFDFTFNFLNCSGTTGLQLQVENAKIDSESFSETIGNNAEMTVDFSFPMSNTTGFRISTPPLFLDQPSVGDSALAVTVTGKSPFTYQWYDTTGILPTATGPTFNPITDGNYYCVVTNGLGSGVSRTTYVDVP